MNDIKRLIEKARASEQGARECNRQHKPSPRQEILAAVGRQESPEPKTRRISEVFQNLGAQR